MSQVQEPKSTSIRAVATYVLVINIFISFAGLLLAVQSESAILIVIAIWSVMSSVALVILATEAEADEKKIEELMKAIRKEGEQKPSSSET
jgi:hypothetical protein